MRILIATQYFAPEVTAAPLRLEPLAAGLAARGHQVEVVCEIPNHPRGIVHPGFPRRPLTTRERDGYRVRYVWVRASPSKRARARLAAYATYAFSATAIGSALSRPDVVFASSPPLSVGAVGAALATRYRVPLVFDVRDLWPQIALALGELEPGPVARGAARLERWLYRHSVAVTTPTAAFRDHIAAIAGSAEKVHVLANGTTRAWLAAGEGPSDRGSIGLPDDVFVWTYAGNLGLSQDLEAAIEAAALLGDDYALLLLGDGTSRQRLEELAAGRGAGTVLFMDSVPVAEAMQIMRASDALLVSLAAHVELGRSVPVKLYDSCAVGRPVIVAAPGEPRRLMQEAGAALTLDPGDPVALADAVSSLRDDSALGERLADAGRSFAAKHLREDGVEQLERLLEEVTA